MRNSYPNIDALSAEKRHLLEVFLREEGHQYNAFPLSFAQERLWFLNQLDPESPFYNIPAAVRLNGTLHKDILAQAFNEVVQRHEALRTTFKTLNGQTVQTIAPALTLLFPVVNLQTLPRDER